MRIAICTLSAVLLSGCSWLGMGSGSSANGCAVGGSQYGGAWNQGAADCGAYGGAYGNGAGAYGQGQNGWGYGSGAGAGGYGAGYGAGAAGYGQGAGAGAGAGYGAGAGGFGAGYGAGAGYGQGAGAGFGAGGAFGPGGAGYGAAGGANGAGYGAGGFGAGAGGAYGAGYGAGAGGAYGPGTTTGYGPGGAYGTGFGPGGATTLGAGAGYGTALGGIAGGQYAQYATGGQVVGGNVQQIQGAPIYVPRPYPAYYQAPRLRLGGAAQPLGIAGFAGISNFDDGNIFGGEAAKPAGTTGRSVSALDAISYDKAFGEGDTFGASLEYDIDRNNTAFISASRTEYDGQTVANGTITQDNTLLTPAGVGTFTDVGQYTFSDLEETTLEAGLRHYVGNNRGVRPYVSGSAGFTHNNNVNLTVHTDDVNVVAAPETQQIIRDSWQPTAAGMIGAEVATGSNFALGLETGLRWTGERATSTKSDDTWSIPVQVRGRFAF